MTLPVTKTLTSFYYKGELYIRAIPAKSLFRSSLIHDVINRGDVMAMRVRDQSLTIIPGKADVIHVDVDVDTPLVTTGQGELF